MKKKLYKSENKMICGVLSGFAEYFDVDPTIIRIAYAALSLFTTGFPGLILYIICAIVIPQKPVGFNNDYQWDNNNNNYNQNQQ